MDKHSVFIIDEDPLIEAISKYGNGAESKDYEFAVSVYMKRFLEKLYNKPFCIVFDIKPGKRDTRRNFTPTPEETNKILREMLQEDTPVDFGLVEGTVDNHSKSGFAFQVKRFIGKSKETFNNELLIYINKVLCKYRPGEASLVVVPDLQDQTEKVQVNLDFIKKGLIIPHGSFKAGFLLLYDQEANIKQLWSNAGLI